MAEQLDDLDPRVHEPLLRPRTPGWGVMRCSSGAVTRHLRSSGSRSRPVATVIGFAQEYSVLLTVKGPKQPTLPPLSFLSMAELAGRVSIRVNPDPLVPGEPDPLPTIMWC